VELDVIVVGAGLTGAAIARDCALRGLSVLLLEARDLGAGATSIRSGLLDPGVVGGDGERIARAREEVSILRRTCGHLLRRVPRCAVPPTLVTVVSGPSSPPTR